MLSKSRLPSLRAGDLGPYEPPRPERYNRSMQTTADLPTSVEVVVTTRGRLPGIADYAREKIAGLIERTRQPVLHAHVRVSRHADPAVICPVVAQANLDVNGTLVRVQVQSTTGRAAIDKLGQRLKHRLERFARRRDAHRAADAQAGHPTARLFGPALSLLYRDGGGSRIRAVPTI